MSGLLHDGARFALKRLGVAPERVTYRAIIELPDQRGFTREVTVDRGDGSVSVGAFEREGEPGGLEAPTEWMVAFLETLTQQVIRSGRKDDVWPRKLRRWKGPPVS